MHKSNMHQKIKELTAAIDTEAKRLGLIFVDGPATTQTAIHAPNFVLRANGKDRFVFNFGIAQLPG